MDIHNTLSNIQTTPKPIQTTSLLKTNSPTYKSRNPKTTPSRVPKNHTLYLIPNRRREQRNNLPSLSLPPSLSLTLYRLISIPVRKNDRPRSLEIQLANSLGEHPVGWTVEGELEIPAPCSDPPSGSRVLDERNGAEVGTTSRQVLVEDTQKVQGVLFTRRNRGSILALFPAPPILKKEKYQVSSRE